MKNELMTVTNVSELVNKDLRKNCNAILKELSKVNKSAWSIAHFYRSIVEAEQWKDDFETFKDFSEYVNIKRATLFLYSKVATISNILKDSETLRDIETVITVSKMIELLPIFKDKDLNDCELIFAIFNGVVDEMGGFDVFADMSNKEVREWVKFWISENEEVEESEESEEVEEVEEAEADEAEAETESSTNILIEDYVLTMDNASDFLKTISNLIKQGHKELHIRVSK